MNVKTVINAIKNIDYYIDEQSDVERYNLEWGGFCDPKPIDKLVHYKELLNRFISKGTCIQNIERIVNRVKDIVGKFKKYNIEYNYIGDNNEWILNNPQCVNYEQWEKSLYQVCTLPNFKINIETTKAKKYAYHISSSPIECEMFFNVYNEIMCIDKPKVDVKSNTIDCDIDLNLESELIDCTIDYDFKTEILNCGFTVNILNKLKECDIKVGYSTEKMCPKLIHKSGAELLCDI